MKDYKVTKIWAIEICNTSEIIEADISAKKHWLQERKQDLANKEHDNIADWEFEQIEEFQEQIKALEWILNTINAPFKISKK